MAVQEFTLRLITVESGDVKPTPPGPALLRENNTKRWFFYEDAVWMAQGGLLQPKLVTTGAYTALASDLIIGVNFAGACTITLPSALAEAGRRYVIKDESGLAATNNITVATEGAELIDGAATAVINTNYGSLGLYSNGTNWFTL